MGQLASMYGCGFYPVSLVTQVPATTTQTSNTLGE